MVKKKRGSIVNIRVTRFEKQRILHHAKQSNLRITGVLAKQGTMFVPMRLRK